MQETFAVVESEVPVWEKEQARWRQRELRKVARANAKGMNKALWTLTHNQYHDSVPLDTVNLLLRIYGFDELEPMILCGRQGKLHEAIGQNKWLTLTWYKMESGRYEVVAYIS